MPDFLTHIWNLRISFPCRDIAIHANNVKSCFRQLKHYPNVMGAFSFVIDTILFLQCGLTFGSNFSLANWEQIQQIAEQLATALFNDHSLQEKHEHHLDKLQWDNSLGNRKQRRFTLAAKDSRNTIVRLSDGLLRPTPHHLFVDNNIYGDIFDSYHIQQAVAASIKAIYILLGESDLSK